MGDAAKLPKYKRVERGLFRSYRQGDAPDHPTGAHTTQVQIGWRTRESDGKRVPNVEHFTADSKTALRRLVDDEKAKAREGYTGRNALPVVEYLRGWLCDKYALVDMAADDWKPSAFRAVARTRVDARHFKTAMNYNGVLERHVLPAIGAYRLDELRPEHIQKVVTASKPRGSTAPPSSCGKPSVRRCTTRRTQRLSPGIPSKACRGLPTSLAPPSRSP